MFITEGGREGLERLMEDDPEYAREKIEKLDELDKSLEDLQKQADEIGEEFKERAKEAAERSRPFVSDGFEGQEKLFVDISAIEKRAEEVEKEKSEIGGEVTDKIFDKEIEEVKKHSEHWADRFVKTKEKIEANAEAEHQKRLEAEEKGKDYFEPYPTIFSRMNQLEMDVEFARGGLTPDTKFGPFDDLRGLKESQGAYFKAKEAFGDKLDKISYGEAVELLEKRYKNGGITEENYEALKRTIRLHYGV